MNFRRADSVFFNGMIMTMSRVHKVVRAVAVQDGRIVAAGNDREVKRSAPRGCDRCDLEGKTVVPGFIDCHTHFVKMGVDSMSVDLSCTHSLEEAMALLRNAAGKARKGEWVVGTGWKESGWVDGRFITRKDLDACCPDNPAVAHRICGHMSSVNSGAISILGIGSDTPGVDKNASGNLTGILRESAVDIARAATAPDRARLIRGLALATRRAHSLGVTSVHDNGKAEDLGLYQEAERSGRLRVRVWFNIPSRLIDSALSLHLRTGLGSDMLRLGGVKVFCDGALGARTAAVSEPYADDPGNLGMLVHDRKDFDWILERANSEGMQLAIHAIGDVGIDVTISSIRMALAKVPRKDHRHRIEHLELPTKNHLREMRRLGLIASMQPNFVGEWGGTDGMYIARIGKARTSRNNPMREVLKTGVRMVFGSDCMPFSPLYGIHSAVNAPHEAQRISVLEALSAYCRDAAYASFEEGAKGTLEVGKLADFVILSSNPIEEAGRISSMSVVKTVLGGEVVFNRAKRKEV